MASGASRALAGELKDLMRNPLEGVQVKLVDDANMFEWEVAIFGPPDTLYVGGYFKTRLKFPDTYPFDPPKMRFVDPIFHPNVYPTGEICISILHPPGEDEQSGELPEERWNPAQRVRTIVLSVVSLLNEPNTFSPADLDASVAYRKWKEGKDDEYALKVKAAVEKSKAVAAAEGVTIPTTVEDYCLKPTEPEADEDISMEMDEYGDDVEFISDDDSDIDNDFDDSDEEDNDLDSGNEQTLSCETFIWSRRGMTHIGFDLMQILTGIETQR